MPVSGPWIIVPRIFGHDDITMHSLFSFGMLDVHLGATHRNRCDVCILKKGNGNRPFDFCDESKNMEGVVRDPIKLNISMGKHS